MTIDIEKLKKARGRLLGTHGGAGYVCGDVPAKILCDVIDAYLAMQPTDEANKRALNATETLVKHASKSLAEKASKRLGETIRAELMNGGWQPIETAPKDGTWIMLSSPLSIGIGQWIERFSSGYEWNNWRFNMMHSHPHKPTHWQPLPAPPVKEGE